MEDTLNLCQCPACGEELPVLAMSPGGLCLECARQLRAPEEPVMDFGMDFGVDATEDAVEETLLCPLCGEEFPVFAASPTGLCPACASGANN